MQESEGKEFRRINPACGEKTGTGGTNRSPRSDQPRVRGEDVRMRPKTPDGTGSTPRAGRRRRPPLAWSRGWIIPACGEKTPSYTTNSSSNADQPRVRGKDQSVSQTRELLRGSTPRAGRRPRRVRTHAAGDRINPACGEKTPMSESRRSRSADQPRVRGEDSPPGRRVTMRDGSTPRAGRRPTSTAWPKDRRRINPACGEKTPRYCTVSA